MMLKFIFILASLATIAPAQAKKAAKEPTRTINFSMKSALDCPKSKDVEICLSSIFGKDIGFEIADSSSLKKVSFHKVYNQDFKINGTLFRRVSNPTIEFHPDRPLYKVCKIREAVQLGFIQLKDSSGCACGFNDAGKFDFQLEEVYSFIPLNKMILPMGAVCTRDKVLASPELKLLQAISTCGYRFPSGTVFEQTVEGVEFLAPADGTIEAGDGSEIDVKKGSKYVNQATKEKPCNWQPSTPDTPLNTRSE